MHENNDQVYTIKNNKKLTVINMFAGPGVGKSTVAHFLTWAMSREGFKVEYVPEYAKELTWNRQHTLLGEQGFILAHQYEAIRKLVEHDIDIAILDSSILLGLMYTPSWYPASFKPFLLDMYHSYDNINIYLERNPDIPYVETGRNQTYEEALQKDKEVLEFLKRENIRHDVVMSGDNAPREILEIVNTLY